MTSDQRRHIKRQLTRSVAKAIETFASKRAAIVGAISNEDTGRTQILFRDAEGSTSFVIKVTCEFANHP